MPLELKAETGSILEEFSSSPNFSGKTYGPVTSYQSQYQDVSFSLGEEYRNSYEDLVSEGSVLLREAAEIEEDSNKGLSEAINIYRDARHKFMGAILLCPDSFKYEPIDEVDPWLLLDVGSCLAAESAWTLQRPQDYSRRDIVQFRLRAEETTRRAEQRILSAPDISNTDKALGAIVVADILLKAQAPAEAADVAELAEEYIELEKDHDTQSHVLETIKRDNNPNPLFVAHRFANQALMELVDSQMSLAA